MSTKTKLGEGNAAERLRRPMPVIQIAPLPAEGAPAVEVRKPASKVAPKRPYRISTYLSEDAAARLNRLIAEFKAAYGRRQSAPDVIERALLALERERSR